MKRARKIMKQIAKNNGVTVETVKKELERAMYYSKFSNDPQTCEFFRKAERRCKKPSAEEFLMFCCNKAVCAVH